MRWRVRLAAASVLAVALLTSGCQAGTVPIDHASPLGEPPATTSPSPTATATLPPADPVVTADACTIAANATQATTQVFSEQMGKLEEAAARKDQAAVVAAAAAINAQFQSLATTLTELAKRQVTPALKTALLDVAQALTQMASPSYTGTSVDILKKLADFAAAFASACAPPTSASPVPA
jgi:hypothetical protein